MKRLPIDKLAPGAIAVAAAAALATWLLTAGAIPTASRTPGRDRAHIVSDGPDGLHPYGPTGPLPIVHELIQGAGSPTDPTGSWSAFRGDQRDGMSHEPVRLSRQWGASGPARLWDIDVGEGYAGATIRNGRIYLLDYDREAQADALRCISPADGRDIWRYQYSVKVKRNHGMSRTVPAVTDQFVVTLGPKCHVLCVDATTGERRWFIDLPEEYGTNVPLWYAGQCPLIDDDHAILAPGAPDVLMMAVDCRTGAVTWRTPNPRRWKMTHASIMPMQLDGQRTYVYCASGGVVGVSAEDGAILWQTDAWKIDIANVSSPLVIGDGRIFLSGGYGAGSMMVQIRAGDDSYVVEPLFRLEPEVFGAAQQTPILHDGLIYGIRPDGQLTCLDLSGQIRWTSGPANRFGLGPLLIADGLIFAMDDDGNLTLADATGQAYRPIAQARVLQGHDSWGPMALAGGLLIVRDYTRMACLDVTDVTSE